MSFSSEAKAELCQIRLDRKCCALAECYGVLLYCNTFSAVEIKIITASADFALRLPKLFRKAFGFGFDKLPPEGGKGKKSFIISDKEKIKKYSYLLYNEALLIAGLPIEDPSAFSEAITELMI